MTIKYLDSKRISLDTSATFTTDFSTGWAETGSQYTIGSNQIDYVTKRDGADHYVNLDLQDSNALGSGNNLSDTAFVVRWHMTNSGNTSDGYTVTDYLTVRSGNTGSGQSQDYFAFRLEHGHRNELTPIVGNGGDLESPTSIGANLAGIVSATMDNYFEIKRTSATSVTFGIYSDSSYSTLVNEQTLTVSSSYTGMRYFSMMTRNSSTRGSTMTGVLNDIKIYNGVTSAPSKPTNVQDNSILVEKDTGRRYWLNSKTLNEDFSSDNWTDIGSNGVTGGHLQLDSYLDGTDNTTYRAITELSDTEFVMKFSFKPSYTGYTTGTWSHLVYFGLASGTGNSASTQDWVTIGIEAWSSGNRKIGGFAINNNTAISDMPSTPANNSIMTFASATTYYCKIIRNGDDFTFNIYSDSAYSTQVGTVTRTVSGITGLDTLVGTNWIISKSGSSGNDGALDCEIDDISIWNGTTTGATWTMEPTFRDEYTGGWTTNSGTGVAVSGGEVTWNIAGNQSNQISKAIGSTLSDTAWVAQFEVELSAYSSGEANILALSSGTAVTAQNSTDDTILVRFADTGKYNVSFRTGNGTDYSYVSTIDKPANGTRHYITLVRNSSTEAILYVRTGSHSGTQVTNSPHTVTQSTMSGATGLDTVTQGGWNTGNSGRTLTMVGDNLKIYNGVTTIN